MFLTILLQYNSNIKDKQTCTFYLIVIVPMHYNNTIVYRTNILYTNHNIIFYSHHFNL